MEISELVLKELLELKGLVGGYTESMRSIDSRTAEILAETKRTNGRVTDLEEWVKVHDSKETAIDAARKPFFTAAVKIAGVILALIQAFILYRIGIK